MGENMRIFTKKTAIWQLAGSALAALFIISACTQGEDGGSYMKGITQDEGGGGISNNSTPGVSSPSNPSTPSSSSPPNPSTPSSQSNGGNQQACTAANNTATQYCSNGTMKTYGTLTDSRDGKKYKTIVIGTQTWMAENLNYETASNSMCYKNDASNCATYGRLYTWATAMSACPAGWHMPTLSERNALGLSIGGQPGEEGKHLKATSGWQDGNGLDTYGFAALPGSMCGSINPTYESLNCRTIGFQGYWWINGESCSEVNVTIEDPLAKCKDKVLNMALCFHYSALNEFVDLCTAQKSGLQSLRCIKN
jgi:uncharacterized protein (TIGR02145 family)